jgi:hypothetical protein
VSWELLLVALLAAAAWYWYAGLEAREQAIVVGRRACTEAGLQLLDESVILRRLRLARNGSGQLQFQRDFHFEFSDTGDNRRPGVIRMLGTRVEYISLDGEWQLGHVANVTHLRD